MKCNVCGYPNLKHLDYTHLQCPKCFNKVLIDKPVSKVESSTEKAEYEKLLRELKKKFDYKKALKSVILLKTEDSTGTGFIISQEGHVITNSHVINGASFCHGTIGDSPMVYELEVISDGGDQELDLCLLKIVEDQEFNYFEIEEAENINIGDQIYTIGNPKGLGLSLTKGTISRIKSNGDLQLDLTVNPGNSGGPLLNEDGRVIGVVSYLLESVNGFGFAISTDNLKEFIEDSEMELQEVDTEDEVIEETDDDAREDMVEEDIEADDDEDADDKEETEELQEENETLDYLDVELEEEEENQ
jgi:S1-C subfamily serine protease